MKKHYPIQPLIEARNYDKNEDIFDADLPAWLKEKMERIARIEKCSIRDLRYEEQIYFDEDEGRWQIDGEIIFYH